MHKHELFKWHEDIGADIVLENAPVNRLIEKKNQENQIDTPNNQGFNDMRKNFATAEKITAAPANFVGQQAAIREARKLADASKTLSELEQAVRNFDGCVLKKTATKTVFSDGISTAKVMLIGEAPGANEDIEGIPFCGASGKLMDEMFAAVNLTRKTNIYISNTIFWRPPGNRKPTPEEVEICRPFVEKHISLINPHIIIMIGGTATEALLKDSTPVTKLRNKTFQYKNPYLEKPIMALATFHPSYLLRQPSQKKLVWHDLLKIRKILKEEYNYI